MYPRAPDDPPSGSPRYVVPSGTRALAVRDGIVRRGEYGRIRTGLRLWVEHADGHRTGYFHLEELLVQPGERVKAGQPIGVVGDDPSVDGDPRHLHLELSPIDAYQPRDPVPYLRGARHRGVAAIAAVSVGLALRRLWGLS